MFKKIKYLQPEKMATVQYYSKNAFPLEINRMIQYQLLQNAFLTGYFSAKNAQCVYFPYSSHIFRYIFHIFYHVLTGKCF